MWLTGSRGLNLMRSGKKRRTGGRHTQGVPGVESPFSMPSASLSEKETLKMRLRSGSVAPGG